MFSAVDKAKETVDGGAIKLFVLESAAVGAVVSIGQDAAGNNPTATEATFTASDEDSAATGNEIALRPLVIGRR